MTDQLIPTASATVGPYFHIGLTWLNHTGMATAATAGQKIVITGRVVDGNGDAIPDAMIELWQANAAGRYDHPEDTRQDKPVDASFHGYGRSPTDNDGFFRFTTVKPGPVPGPGNTLQAPHIVVALFMRGLLKHAYTRIYFADEAQANSADPILGLIEDEGRRATLLAKPGANGEYRWDIVMQGADETVFFDV